MSFGQMASVKRDSVKSVSVKLTHAAFALFSNSCHDVTNILSLILRWASNTFKNIRSPIKCYAPFQRLLIYGKGFRLDKVTEAILCQVVSTQSISCIYRKKMFVLSVSGWQGVLDHAIQPIWKVSSLDLGKSQSQTKSFSKVPDFY